MVFRAFLAFHAALPILAGVVGVTSWWPQRTIEQHFSPSIELGIKLVVLAAAIVVFVGYWQFRRWARTTYLAIAVLLIMYFVLRPQPVFASSSFLALLSLEYALNGAIITMTYLPPLAERFAKRKA